jgi:uncharacterized protein YaaN involved in tellurite resistance
MVDINIDLDAIASNTLKNKVLTTDETTDIIVSSGNFNQARFLEKLSIDQQKQIQSRVPEMVSKFIDDQNSLLDFGTSSVENVNQTVSHLLNQQKKIDIPQVDNILSNANRELAGFSAKYKGKTIAQLEKKKNSFMKLFSSAKQSLKDLHFDSKKLEDKLDFLASQLVKHEHTLAENIGSSELLIEENLKSIDNLIGVISFIEACTTAAADLAKKQQSDLATLDSSSSQYHDLSEKLARTSEVVNTLEQQHTEYVSRLYIAWSTTPQMRNIIKISSDLRQKLGMLRRNTLPTMKLTIAQLGILQQSIHVGNVADAVANANNLAIQTLADTAKSAIPALEQSAGRTSLSVESVIKIAQSIVDQNDGIIHAIENGRQKRAEIEQNIVTAAEMITNSAMVRDEKIVSSILENAKQEQKLVEA